MSPTPEKKKHTIVVMQDDTVIVEHFEGTYDEATARGEDLVNDPESPHWFVFEGHNGIDVKGAGAFTPADDTLVVNLLPVPDAELKAIAAVGKVLHNLLPGKMGDVKRARVLQYWLLVDLADGSRSSRRGRQRIGGDAAASIIEAVKAVRQQQQGGQPE